jgi:hypothetical protein
MCALWAIVGITAGWMWASRTNYRDPVAVTWTAVVNLPRAERPIAALEGPVVGVAKVPVWNTVSEAAAAPYVGVASSVVIRTRLKRHAVTGPDCYAPRTTKFLEYAA